MFKSLWIHWIVKKEAFLIMSRSEALISRREHALQALKYPSLYVSSDSDSDESDPALHEDAENAENTDTNEEKPKVEFPAPDRTSPASHATYYGDLFRKFIAGVLTSFSKGSIFFTNLLFVLCLCNMHTQDIKHLWMCLLCSFLNSSFFHTNYGFSAIKHSLFPTNGKQWLAAQLAKVNGMLKQTFWFDFDLSKRHILVDVYENLVGLQFARHNAFGRTSVQLLQEIEDRCPPGLIGYMGYAAVSILCAGILFFLRLSLVTTQWFHCESLTCYAACSSVCLHIGYLCIGAWFVAKELRHMQSWCATSYHDVNAALTAFDSLSQEMKLEFRDVYKSLEQEELVPVETYEAHLSLLQLHFPQGLPKRITEYMYEDNVFTSLLEYPTTSGRVCCVAIQPRNRAWIELCMDGVLRARVHTLVEEQGCNYTFIPIVT
jgi:hypothetical protein